MLAFATSVFATAAAYAEMARMDAEIVRLRQQAQQPGQLGSSPDQIIALGERRETAAELLAAQRKAESERQKREAEIARMKAEARAKRKAEFEAAYAKYQRVVECVEKGHLGAAEHLDAWKAICGDFGVKAPDDKPAALAWNDADGTVQISSLRVHGLGATGAPTPSTGGGVVAVGGDPGRMGAAPFHRPRQRRCPRSRLDRTGLVHNGKPVE